MIHRIDLHTVHHMWPRYSPGWCRSESTCHSGTTQYCVVYHTLQHTAGAQLLQAHTRNHQTPTSRQALFTPHLANSSLSLAHYNLRMHAAKLTGVSQRWMNCTNKLAHGLQVQVEGAGRQIQAPFPGTIMITD
jgi:hypothetical protein